MRLEGKVKSKQMMQLKGKEVGYTEIEVLWSLDKKLIGTTLNIKIDVFSMGTEDLQVGENYFIELAHLGTILRAISFKPFAPFAKLE